MKSSSLARKPLRMALTCFLAAVIAAGTMGAKEPPMDRFCGAPDPVTGEEECWWGPAWELNDAPYYYLPRITGTMTVGSTLTAVARPNDLRWTLITYQWLRDGTPVAGATTATYRLTNADIGKTIGLKSYGEADFYQDAGETFTAEAPVKGYAMTPGAPAVSGTGRVGSVLTVSPGTWTAGTSYAYRWLRNGAAITGATAMSYKLTEADRGQRIAVRVTGSKPLFTTLTRTVLGAGSVAPSSTTVLNRTLPTLTGAPVVGSVLKAAPGTWSQSGLTYRYQWLRDRSIPIPGATGSSYKVTAADLAFRSVTVKVYAVKRGWTSGTALSGPTGRILPAR